MLRLTSLPQKTKSMNFFLHSPLTLGVLAIVGAAPSTAFAQDNDSAWSFFGDARVRAEFNDLAANPDRHRQRLRFRFGGNFNVADNVTIGTRMRTESGDQNNPHWDIGNNFDNMDVSLDRMFVDYSPTWTDVRMKMGKFGHGFQANPVYGELVWDGDVQPEGLAVSGSSGDFDWVVGQYALTENGGGTSEDSWMTVGQVNTSKDDLKFAVGYYFYGDPDAAGAEAYTGTDVGNWGILNPIVSWKKDSLTISGEYIENVRAGDGFDATGWALGVSNGSPSDSGGKFYAQYQTVEEGAVFTTFAGDDFPGGRDDWKGLMGGWKRQLSDKIGLNIWALTHEQESINSETDYRFRIDFNIKF